MTSAGGLPAIASVRLAASRDPFPVVDHRPVPSQCRTHAPLKFLYHRWAETAGHERGTLSLVRGVSGRTAPQI